MLDVNPGVSVAAGPGEQSDPRRVAARRSGRAPEGEQGLAARSSTTPSTSRCIRPPARGTPLGVGFAGLGGNTNYTELNAEGTWYQRVKGPMSIGLRALGQYTRPYGSTTDAADLRENLPRRRVQHSRLRHPHGVAARSDRRVSSPAATRRSCSMPSTTWTSGRCACWRSTTPGRSVTSASSSSGTSPSSRSTSRRRRRFRTWISSIRRTS